MRLAQALLPFPVRQPPPRPARPQFLWGRLRKPCSLRASAPRALTLQAARAAAGKSAGPSRLARPSLVACAVVRRAGPVRQPRWPAVRSRSARQVALVICHRRPDLSSPALSASGAIYVGSDDDFLYALDGKERQVFVEAAGGNCAQTLGWVPTQFVAMWTAATIGWTNHLFRWRRSLCRESQRRSRWRFATGGHVSTAPAVMPDGTVIAGSMDNNLYAINKDGTSAGTSARAPMSSPALPSRKTEPSISDLMTTSSTP